MVTADDDAWGKLAEDEANALALLLDRPDRKVLVVVIGTDGADGYMVQGVSTGTRRSHGRAFIDGLQRKIAMLRERTGGAA